MKFACVVFIVFAVLFAVEAQKAIKTTKMPSSEECEFCSNGVSENNDCVCSLSLKQRRKYACGPACDALGSCCASVGKCPPCSGIQNPTADSECTCDKSSTKVFRKYACGPACDAAGYCCDPQSITPAPSKQIKCKPVE